MSRSSHLRPPRFASGLGIALALIVLPAPASPLTGDDPSGGRWGAWVLMEGYSTAWSINVWSLELNWVADGRARPWGEEPVLNASVVAGSLCAPDWEEALACAQLVGRAMTFEAIVGGGVESPGRYWWSVALGGGCSIAGQMWFPWPGSEQAPVLEHGVVQVGGTFRVFCGTDAAGESLAGYGSKPAADIWPTCLQTVSTACKASNPLVCEVSNDPCP